MPMNQVSNIDVAIGKSFNDLIFRLTGSNNPTNIKKIAPSLKIKKDFLISYEPININDQPYLITKKWYVTLNHYNRQYYTLFKLAVR